MLYSRKEMISQMAINDMNGEWMNIDITDDMNYRCVARDYVVEILDTAIENGSAQAIEDRAELWELLINTDDMELVGIEFNHDVEV